MLAIMKVWKISLSILVIYSIETQIALFSA